MNDDLTRRSTVSGVYTGTAIDTRTGWAGVMVTADAPAVVLDADQARLLAAALNRAAEDADRENQPNTHPEGDTP